MSENLATKNLVSSVVKAIDKYNYLLKDHHRRTASIAFQLGNMYGLDKTALDNLVLAASLHDIGALSVTERDRLIEIDVEDPKPHEELGAKMLEGFKPFERVSKIVRHHHIIYSEVIDGSIDADEVPFECYLLNLSDRIDVLSLRYAEDENKLYQIKMEIEKRFGKVFNPLLKPTFDALVSSEEFWENIESEAYGELLFLSIDDQFQEITREDVNELAVIFAKIVDLKSHWTSTHSQTVGMLANKICRMMSLSEEDCFDITIAGYLNDIGKVSVPTEIIDKPGYLDDNEFKTMKSHALYTNIILNSIHGFNRITKWASSHHEKRDGSGYPRKLSENQFDIQMDILAYADIFSALTEDRPYRSALGKDELVELLATYAPEKLSMDVYQIILNNIDELFEFVQNLKAWAGSQMCLLTLK